MATITGDDDANFLIGSTDADVIYGLGGNDTLSDIYTGDKIVAADSLYGGDGDDLIYGGAPGFLDGGDGNDTVSYADVDLGPVRIALAEAGTSSARVNYQWMSENEWYENTVRNFENVTGSRFNDTITGNSQDNLLLGLAGNDVIDGGGGNDTLFGGDGMDIISFWDAAGPIDFDLNASTFVAPDGGTVTLFDFEGAYGSRFQDTIRGTAEANYIDGKSGSDMIHGGIGDTIIGGAGMDTLDVGDLTDDLTINLRNTGFQNIGPGRMKISQIETLKTGSGNDSISGSTTAEVIVGRQGNDSISGGGGADRLFGGAGFDSLYGGGSGSEYLDGGANHDLLMGLGGNDTLVGGTGNDTLYGGSGFDVALFNIASSTANVVINLALTTAQNTGEGLDILDHIEGVEAYGGASVRLLGTGGANLLSSTTGRDSLYGGAGNDTLDGGAGNDDLYGGAGFDLLRVSGSQGVTINLGLTDRQTTGLGSDLIREIEGVVSGGGRDHLMGNAYANALYGGTGSDTISGGAGNDTLFGEKGNDVLNAGTGNDVLNGGLGNDGLYGGDGIDRAVFNTGVDVSVNLAITTAQNTGEGMDVLQSVERLTTGTGNDRLRGNAEANLLDGDAGNDTLIGARGDDTLTGGAGQDQFVFDPTSGWDQITDFARGEDKVVINWAGHDFHDLQLTAQGDDTVVRFGASSITIVGIHPWIMDASDFDFS